jgi:SAM-dependent methyltransferase
MTDVCYHETRFVYDKKREVVWNALWRFFFSKWVKRSDHVVDFGCGYGSFINEVDARLKTAVDLWPGAGRHLNSGINFVRSNLADLDFLEDNSVDFAFSSNLYEHLTKEHFIRHLTQLKNKLKSSGRVALLQPNYRYCFREYFDDFTHESIYSHVSMCDLLESQGYTVEFLEPRFLPLTVKSKFPVHWALIWLYLKLPFKPFGKQMLIVAKVAAKV